MSQPNGSDERIRRLERQQRVLLVLCLGAISGLLAHIGWEAFRVPKVVVAQRFTVRDGEGRVRGDWGPSELVAGEQDGHTIMAPTTCLSMKGKAKQGIVACTPWDGDYGPMFLMSDETGSRVQMTVGPYEAQARFATKPPSGAGPKPTIDIALGAKRAYMKVTDGSGQAAMFEPDALHTIPADSQPANPRGGSK